MSTTPADLVPERTVLADGTVVYMLDDVPHRVGGPALSSPYGDEQWRVHGLLHRANGPAVRSADGFESWWFNGKRHRVGGPAIKWPDGTVAYYVDGQQISSESLDGRPTMDEVWTVVL